MTAQVNEVWSPLSGSQELALSFNGNHIIVEGTRGGGKTDAQLMFFRQFVGLGFGEYWRGVIFDREYKNLDDIVARSKRWFYKMGDGAKFTSSIGAYKWTWPTGEELLFRAIKKEDDYWGYHGQEFPYIGWNELVKFPKSVLYDMMMSCNRSSYVPETGGMEIPHVVFSTANPYGAGHNWVKKRFISIAKPGEVVTNYIEIFNPRTQKDDVIKKTQVRLFSSFRENIYLSPQYIAELYSITDKNKRKAWLEGSWDIVSGGAFDDIWNKSKHVIKPFEIPESWYFDRSFDWGSSSPFSVLWFAESNGEQIEGQQYYPKGTIFVINEWYGCNAEDNNAGLYMKSGKIAEGIVERETKMAIAINVGAADSAIYNIIDGNSIADNMEEEGVYWERCSKGAGSRVIGLETIRSYLSNSVENPLEKKGLYIFDNCKHLIENLPVLPRDSKNPDDVDTEAQDHDYDALRYRLTTEINKGVSMAGYY